MNLSISTHFRLTIVLLISALVFSGCSSSDGSTIDTNGVSDSSVEGSSTGQSTDTSAGSGTLTTDTDSTGGDANSTDSDSNSQDPNPILEDTLVQNNTLVTFDITVPVLVSNALQVKVVWGEKELTAAWIVDESWSVSDTFPTNTENQLVVTFSDDNGAITLGSFETNFKTGTRTSENVQINASQFNTNQWDNNNDGVSNLDELNADANSGGDDVLQPIQASLELVPDKTFHLNWQPVSGAIVYRVFENPDGRSGFTQISEDLNAQTESFVHRVALYERFNASYFVQACDFAGACVDSDLLIVAGTLDEAVGYFKGSNTGASDRFGNSISLSLDGNTMAIGTPGEASSAAGINGAEQDDSLRFSGAVYIFQRIEGQWAQTSYLKASNPDSGDAFGGRVSLSADGTTLAVGASGEASATQVINGNQADNSESAAGAVYIFELTDNQWAQTFYLKASNGRSIAYLGGLLSLSGDGNTLVTSGNYTSNNGAGDVVYIFDRTGDSWHETIIASSHNAVIFGADGITLSSDGNTLVIGDPRLSRAESKLGSAHVYIRISGGWQKQASLRGDNTEKGDRFGFGNSLAISADGNTIAVGASYEAGASVGINNKNIWNENASYQAGAVYMFQRRGESWQQQAYIKASNTDAEDQFGSSVSLNSTGDILAVGAPEEHGAATGINGDATDNSIPKTAIDGGDGSGAAYLFTLDDGEWSQRAYVKSTNTEAADLFGRSLALSGDGKTLAIGASAEDSSSTGIDGNQADNSASNSGAVYLY